MEVTAAGETEFHVSDPTEIHQELVQAYNSALNTAYPDPADEPDFPVDMEITVELQIDENPTSGGESDVR